MNEAAGSSGEDFETTRSRVALVTGGAGDIGRAVAERLSGAGMIVAVADIDAEAVEAVAARCRNNGGTSAAFGCDQTDEQSVISLVNAVHQRYGRIDAVFANAGYGRYRPALELSVAEWNRHLNINLTGTFLVCREAAKVMKSAGVGSIVITASSAATVPLALFSAYCASKAGVAMLGRVLATEFATFGVRVNVVMPGVIETRMTRSILGDQRIRNLLEADTPLGRIGQPTDVAGLVEFLLSDSAAYITGGLFVVDGGQSLASQPRWFAADGSLGPDAGWSTLHAHYTAILAKDEPIR